MPIMLTSYLRTEMLVFESYGGRGREIVAYSFRFGKSSTLFQIMDSGCTSFNKTFLSLIKLLESCNKSLPFVLLPMFAPLLWEKILVQTPHQFENCSHRQFIKCKLLPGWISYLHVHHTHNCSICIDSVHFVLKSYICSLGWVGSGGVSRWWWKELFWNRLRVNVRLLMK